MADPASTFHWLWVIIIGVGIVAIALQLLRWQAWRRIVARYPATFRKFFPERRILAGRVVVGTGLYQNTVWLGISDAHLHVCGIGLSRATLRQFSVPWSDITAEPDVFHWGPYKLDMMRLNLARAPGERFLVRPEEFRLLANASMGQLRDAATGSPVPWR